MAPSSAAVKLGAAAALAVAAAGAYYFLQRFYGTADDTSAVPAADNIQFSIDSIPVVDIAVFFAKEFEPEKYAEECRKVAYCLHHFGVAVVKDPRVSEADNERFLNMMEKYFEGSDGVRDARPNASYQVGVTAERIEKARDHSRIIDAMSPENRPDSPRAPIFDSKWRFFWRIGPRPPKSDYPLLNLPPVIPPEFPEWKSVMDGWGNKMSDALFTLAEMLAVGFGQAPDTYTSRMLYGAHLLAPTGSDFNKYTAAGTVLAGFHYDLNFLTIHGKSRYPGLSVWTKDQVKFKVKVPDGCLLVQAGKQVEHLTGGHVMAGFHEVIITEDTKRVIDERRAKQQSLWRVSSTLFGHIQSDQILEPLAPFNTPEAVQRWPAIKCGEHVQRELQACSLGK